MPEPTYCPRCRSVLPPDAPRNLCPECLLAMVVRGQPAAGEREDSGVLRSRANADRNLLFGILALQMDFIPRDALIAAMNAWVLDKRKTLGQILVAQRALDPQDQALLEPMIARHVQIHGGDS